MNALARIDAAREILPERPSRALSVLPPIGETPRPLRDERNFLEAEARRAMGFFNAAEAIYRRVLRGKDDPVLLVEACLGSAAGLRSLGQVKEASARIKAARTAAKRSDLRTFGERFELEDAMILRAAGFYTESLRRLRPLLELALRSREWGGGVFSLLGRRRSRALPRPPGRFGEGVSALFSDGSAGARPDCPGLR